MMLRRSASGEERPGFPNQVVPEGLADLVIAGVTEVGRSVYVETASACDEPPYRGTQSIDRFRNQPAHHQSGENSERDTDDTYKNRKPLRINRRGPRRKHDQ